jgi:hypothetical protein
LIVDVRVVDDFAGEIDRAIGETAPRLIGVVDGSVDAVAKAELPREMDRQPAGVVAVVVVLDLLDEDAVIAVSKDPGNFVLEIEALAKYDWWH